MSVIEFEHYGLIVRRSTARTYSHIIMVQRNFKGRLAQGLASHASSEKPDHRDFNWTLGAVSLPIRPEGRSWSIDNVTQAEHDRYVEMTANGFEGFREYKKAQRISWAGEEVADPEWEVYSFHGRQDLALKEWKSIDPQRWMNAHLVAIPSDAVKKNFNMKGQVARHI